MEWTEADIRAVVGPQRCRVLMGLNPTPLPEDTPEATLLTNIRTLAHQQGWLFHHVKDSRGCDPGYPDICCVKPGHPVLFAELKSRTGKVTEEQATWLGVLSHSVPPVQVFVWRPQDWAEIVTILTRSTP